MAELFLGGKVDPATHERTGDDVRIGTDNFTTHGVIVGMTGSGKTGLGVVLIEEVLAAGLPALLIDPKGDLTNLCLTFPDAAAGRLPPVDRRGPGHGGRPVRPTTSPRSRPRRGRRASLGWGLTAQNIAALRVDDRLHDLHARLAVGRAGEHRRVAAGARRHGRRRGRRRRDRGLRVGPARAGRHRGRPAVEPRAHPAVQPHPPRLDRGPRARPADAGRPGRQPADPQARRVRARPVLPAERPHGAGDEAQRAARVAVVRGMGRRAAARHPVDAATPPTARAAARSSPPRTSPTRSASSSRR